MTNRSTARALVEQAGVVLEEAHSLYRRRAWNLVVSHAHRLPEVLRGQVAEMAAISRRLAREREPAFYGDEDTDTPPQELYEEADAHWALADAEKVVRWTQDVLASLQGPG